jgi:hypothetical protein
MAAYRPARGPLRPAFRCNAVSAAVMIAASGEWSASKAPKSVAIKLPGRITAAGMLAGPLFP